METELLTEPPKKASKRRPYRRKNKDALNNGNGEINNEVEKAKNAKKSGRGTSAMDYTDENAIKPSIKIRRINATILANSKPSYCFKRGIGTCFKNQGGSFRAKYTKTLRRLLKKLIGAHNWVEATGVLAVLVFATDKDKSLRNNRFKYWAAMEIMKKKKGDYIDLRAIQIVYDLWMVKTGKMKRSYKEWLAIQLEYILFCLTHGDLESAKQSALGLMQQERGFESDPNSNLVLGLLFYELWYSGLPTKWQLKNLNHTGDAMQSEFHESRANSDEYDAIESQENIFSMEVNSVTSVANDKGNTEVDSSHERVPMDVDNLQTQCPQQSVCHDDSYVYSAEGSEDQRSLSPAHDDGLSVSIFQAPGLPPWLLPLTIPTNDKLDKIIEDHRNLQNGHYSNAVKHLQAALHSTPPMVEALHPLIQVLLIGDRVNEALHELDNFFDDSATALRLRLKVGLLEHFDRGNHLQLSSCHEEILEVDPTCSNSLVKLINMHRRGDYGTEKLVKMIGLYLDATYAGFSIWKDLASSLLILSQCAGDQMSICTNGNGKEINQSYTGNSSQIPELFRYGESGKTWRFRCKWWLTRHFSSNILSLEIATAEIQLLTYKAAVAAFLYGPGFKYVTKATEILENDSANHDLYSVLRIHVRNYVGIYKG